ncbi:MAG: carboxypeptidase-like regulatory domain-containing protein [Flavobacteriales bacterium]|nr:carboxypeptidase-like regulatory domain-containing protein [Flavobacteriales bacterium]
MKQLFTFLLLIVAVAVYSQNGIIKGQVTNKRNNESVPFASIILQGSDQGASSDLDGYYELTGLKPGVYNIEVSFIGFEKQVIY